MELNYFNMTIQIQKKILYFVAILAILIVLDQASKTYLINFLKEEPGHMVELAPFLDIVYAWNYGISFGLFSDHYQYSNITFLALNSFIILYISYLALKSETCLSFLGLTVIIGGALGNLCDRIFLGSVFDFLYFHYGDFHFPAFNLADSFITIGAGILIYEYFFCASIKNSEKTLDDKSD
jgi:signal peptidase II